MVFSSFTRFYHHHHYLVLERLHYSRAKPCAIKWSFAHHISPHPLANTQLLSVPIHLPILDISRKLLFSHCVVSNSFATAWTVCSPPGSSVHGILQARILEWAAIPFSRGSSQPREWTWVSCIGRQILYITRETHNFIWVESYNMWPFVSGCFHLA